jgi:hypothetical protein
MSNERSRDRWANRREAGGCCYRFLMSCNMMRPERMASVAGRAAATSLAPSQYRNLSKTRSLYLGTRLDSAARVPRRAISIASEPRSSRKGLTRGRPSSATTCMF